MNDQNSNVSSYVIDAWKCPKCGANNRFNPNICTSCNYSKIPPIQVLPPQSRRVWEKISFVMIILMLALQITYAVTMVLGVGLNIFYGIGGEFLDTALQVPDMLLYTHYGTGAACGLVCLWTVWDLISTFRDKERLTGALQRTAFITFIFMWAFPAINLLTDLIVTAIRVDGVNLRQYGAYDLFDMGPSVLIPVIVSLVCFAVMYVNNRLAPEEKLSDDE